MLLKIIVFFSVIFFFFGCAKEEIVTSQRQKEIIAQDADNAAKKETIADEFYEKLKLKKPKSIEKTKLYDFGYMYFNKEEK